MGGGSEYVRGYEYYVIDGSQYGIVRSNLKFQALNKTIRGLPLRFLPSIPIAAYPKVFADVGWARNILPGNSFLNNRLLYGAGLGIDVITAYGLKARLEVSWNGLGERGLFFHQDAE
jgi:hemolysin activation/secretion protein